MIAICHGESAFGSKVWIWNENTVNIIFLPGTYSSASGSTGSYQCTSCPSGTYSSAEGATLSSTCTSCPAGTTSSSGSNSVNSCNPCPAGNNFWTNNNLNNENIINSDKNSNCICNNNQNIHNLK